MNKDQITLILIFFLGWLIEFKIYLQNVDHVNVKNSNIGKFKFLVLQSCIVVLTTMMSFFS
jgi:hypothetical protein